MNCGLGLIAVVTSALAQAQGFVYRYPYIAGNTSDYYSEKYGWSIASNDEWVVVGSPFANGDLGEVRVYPTGQFLNGTSAQPEVLTDVPENARKFGSIVAAYGTTIAVGNCSAQGGSEYCGEEASWVSIFTYDGTSWQQMGRILRPVQASGRFGSAIALYGDWLAIGGARTGTQQEHIDKVYLYHRDADGFSNAPNDSLMGNTCSGVNADDFGYALAMTAEHLVVGARSDDELGPDAGAGYVYHNDGGDAPFGYLVRKLLPSDGDGDDLFGFSVAVRGDLCLVGAPEKDVNGSPAGAAYVFDREEGFADNWGQVSVLAPPPQADTDELEPDMQFGASVAISADRIAVGAPQDSLGTDHLQGSVSLFAANDTGWGHQQTIRPRFDGGVNDVSRSGTAITFAYGSLLVGAPWAIVQDTSTFPTGGVLVYADPLLGLQERPLLRARVWPVPATDHLMISVESPCPVPIRTIVRDATGRAVADRSHPYGGLPVRLDLSSFRPGPYILEVTAPDGGSFRSLFIRQ